MPRRAATSDPERWLERHGDAMYGYALLRLGDPEGAEEAVQEALLHALQSGRSFEGRSSERTWLIGILRHKVIDRIRREGRRRRAEAPEAATGEAPVEAPPAGELERSELRGALLRAIARLPEPMRQALCLREMDGLSTDQVCEVLGVTPTNLWTLVHRAKVRLRDELAEWWNEETPAGPSTRPASGGSDHA